VDALPVPVFPRAIWHSDELASAPGCVIRAERVGMVHEGSKQDFILAQAVEPSVNAFTARMYC